MMPKGKTQTTSRRGKKLMYFLARLSAAELQELALWLGSPLHSHSLQFVAMLELILKAMQAKEFPELTVEMFAETLSPQRSLDGKKTSYIWVRVSQLQEAVLAYIAWTRYRKDLPAQRRYLLEEVCDRGWEKHIPEAYADSIKALPQPAQARRFREELDVEEEYANYLAGKGAGTPGQDKHIKEINDALDNYYLLQKLKFACGAVLERDPNADPTHSLMLALVIANATAMTATLPQVTEAYLRAFLMLRGHLDNDSAAQRHFQAFDALFENPSAFEASEALDLFYHGQNFCILNYRTGNLDYVEHLQRLYDRVLQSNLGLQSGLMQPSFYKNTVELMCRLGKLDWVEGFVESYRDRISHDPSQRTYSYNRAVLRFYQGQFHDVVHLLYNVIPDLDRLQIGTGARTYLCQSLWEIGEMEWLLSVLDAFEQHLRRDAELTVDLRDRYKRFIGYLRRTCEARLGNPSKVQRKLQIVLQDLEAHEPPNLHRWMRAKLSEAIAATEELR
jgi:hypothetical protein